jgi:hypothetical protein
MTLNAGGFNGQPRTKARTFRDRKFETNYINFTACSNHAPIMHTKEVVHQLPGQIVLQSKFQRLGESSDVYTGFGRRPKSHLMSNTKPKSKPAASPEIEAFLFPPRENH